MGSLDTAREALAAGSWGQADSAFRAVLEESADPLAYEGLAQAGWWLDDAETCLTAREAAYRRHRELNDPVGAARAATALAWDCVLFGRGESVARGWLGRAHELLEAVEERTEHGWVLVREAELALSVHQDPIKALECASSAAGVGRRAGDDDLTVVGLALQGLALTRSGEVEAGMARLDSAVAAATAGDVADLMWMGKVLCWLIAACHDTQDVTRARSGAGGWRRSAWTATSSRCSTCAGSSTPPSRCPGASGPRRRRSSSRRWPASHPHRGHPGWRRSSSWASCAGVKNGSTRRRRCTPRRSSTRSPSSAARSSSWPPASERVRGRRCRDCCGRCPATTASPVLTSCFPRSGSRRPWASTRRPSKPRTSCVRPPPTRATCSSRRRGGTTGRGYGTTRHRPG